MFLFIYLFIFVSIAAITYNNNLRWALDYKDICIEKVKFLCSLFMQLLKFCRWFQTNAIRIFLCWKGSITLEQCLKITHVIIKLFRHVHRTENCWLNIITINMEKFCFERVFNKHTYATTIYTLNEKKGLHVNCTSIYKIFTAVYF